MMWDIAYENFHNNEIKATDSGHLLKSGLTSHVFGVVGLVAFRRYSSVLAPPASISVIKDEYAKINFGKRGSVKAMMKRFFR